MKLPKLYYKHEKLFKRKIWREYAKYVICYCSLLDYIKTLFLYYICCQFVYKVNNLMHIIRRWCRFSLTCARYVTASSTQWCGACRLLKPSAGTCSQGSWKSLALEGWCTLVTKILSESCWTQLKCLKAGKMNMRSYR